MEKIPLSGLVFSNKTNLLAIVVVVVVVGFLCFAEQNIFLSLSLTVSMSEPLFSCLF